MSDKQDDSGVSPVIGVILMVAVAVALVALVTVTAFDLGGDVSESPDATVQFDETDSTISARVLRNENVESLKLIAPDGSEIGAASTVGDSIEDSSKQTGNYKMVAVMPDGNEEVLTITSTGSTGGGSESGSTGMSGTVSINPPIQGAIVEAVDSDGNVIGSATTDSNGEYTIDKKPANVDEIIVSVEGFSSGATSNPLYTSTSVPANSETVNVDFDETSTFDHTVNGSSVTIIYNGSGTSSDPYQVGNLRQLQAIENDLTDHYELVQDIDASGTSSWNSGDGFEPISEFTGSLDGDGYVIDGLYINLALQNDVGLLRVSEGSVSDIGVVNADVTGANKVGVLVGKNNGNVTSSYSTASVSGNTDFDGDYVGGLVGKNNGNVTSSYSTASVSGGDYVGGLVGWNDGGTVEDSYSTGSVSGTFGVGGLVGNNNGNVTSSYSTGSVSGDTVGGLVGSVGLQGIVTPSYWDTESSGQSSSPGGTGLTTSEMTGSSAETNMTGLDFTNTWSSEASGEYPALAWESE